MEKVPQDSVSRNMDKYIVRFPEGMRDQIADAAKATGRSMNAEIVKRLEQSFDLPHIIIRDAPDVAALEHRILQLEVEIVARRLDLGDVSMFIAEVEPSIPKSVIDGNPELKTNLKMLRRILKRFALSESESAQLEEDHRKKLTVAVKELERALATGNVVIRKPESKKN